MEIMDISSEDASNNVKQIIGSNSDDNDDGIVINSNNCSDEMEILTPEKMVCESEDVPDEATSCIRLQTIVDSESDDDDMTRNKRNNDNNKELSDSELEENDDGPLGNNTKRKSKSSKVRIESDSDSDEDNNQINQTLKSNRISNLIDSESEEDESVRNVHQQVNSEDSDNNTKEEDKTEEKSSKKKHTTKRAAKDEAMHKIHSETQRLIRESSVYLPYHRPKQRSLGEFLERKKVAPSLPKGSSIKNKLKISATIVDQVLEEKEEEAEMFYKSSDSEEEGEEEKEVESDDKPMHDVSTIEPAVISESQGETCIEETQKLQKGDIQKRQQVIHNGSLEFGVPRKLFLDDECPPSIDEQTPGEERDSLIDDHKHQPKEHKNLKDVGMPRKLFDENFQQSDNGEEQNSHETGSAIDHDTITNDTEMDTTAKDCQISDTPILSNKEIMKINKKNIAPDDSCLEKGETTDPIEKTQQQNGSNKLNTKKSFLSNLAKLPQPKLHGSVGMMIDLTATVKPDKAAINNLVDRFLTKHAPSTKQEAKNAELIVLNTEVTPEGLKITKDIIPYKIKTETTEDSELNKPGAKYTKFKAEMEKTMASKRKEEWEQKEKEDEKENESNDEDDEYEPEDKPDNAEMDAENDDDDNEIEMEEEDIDEECYTLKERKRKSCPFGDDEAQESGDENIENEEEEDEEEDEDDNEEGQEDNEEEDDEGWTNEQRESKKFSRIIAMDDESNSGDETSQPIASIATNEEKPSSQMPKIFSEEMSQIDSTSQLSSASFNMMSPTQVPEESGSLNSMAFPDTQNFVKPDLNGLVNSDQSSSQMITDSQLMNLCSGSFATQTPISETDLSASTKPSVNNSNIDTIESKNQPFALQICSSSDEENNDENVVAEQRTKKLVKKKKKKVQQLLLSDDEGEEETNVVSSDEEIEEVQSDDEKFIDYDSEENEVVVVPKKDIKKVAANFLEEEAELSESDWGSADEDEKDMDKYEVEDGDNEEIDESIVRDQIGRVQVRQLLDEDNRDVRMLKEMLFDDGDLHDDKGGRERKFKWKNIDSIGLGDSNGLNDEENGADGADDENNDAASEIEWRKLRLERQRFLDERAKPENGEDIDGGEDDQLFKLGMKALGRKKNSLNHNSPASPSINKKKNLVPRSVSDLIQFSSNNSRVMRKGSFLARGEQVLAKLAMMTKQCETVTLAPASAGNFVFTHLSPSVAGSTGPAEDDDDDEDRGENRHSNNNSKAPISNKFDKKRKITAGGTPRTTKKARVEVDQTSGKKLF